MMVRITVQPAGDGTAENTENVAEISSDTVMESTNIKSVISRMCYISKTIGHSAMTRNLKGEDLDNHANQYRDCSLYEAMKPLFFSLRLCGLHHYKAFRGGSSKWYFSRIYASVLLVILWLNVIRTATMFNKKDKFGPELFSKIISISWVTLCTINFTCCFYSCESINCLSKFFLQWKSFHPEANNKCCKKYLKPRAVIYTIVCWILILLTVIFNNYIIFATPMYTEIITPFEADGKYNMLWRVLIVGVIQTWLSCGWILPMGLFYMICIIIYYEFKALNIILRSQINKDDQFVGCLGDIRMRHQAITRMLAYADNFLKILVAAALMADIILLCLMMYNLMYYPALLEEPVILLVFLFWILTCIASMLILSVGPAYVNQEVSYFFSLNL